MKKLIVLLLLLLVIPCQAADQSGNFIPKAVTCSATGSISGFSTAKSFDVTNFGQADDVVCTLDTIRSGIDITVILGTTVAKYWRLTAGANDKLYLDGVAGSDGGYIGIASAVAGAALSCRAFQTGAGSYDWYCGSSSGNWVAGGP